jgi:AraC-like DNA-binding protein
MQDQNPVVQAGLLSGLDRFLESRGIDAEQLFARSGLDLKMARDPEKQISLNGVTQLFENAAAVTGDPCFGLSWAEAFPVGGTGVFGYLVTNSQSVDEALNTAAKFAGLLRQPFEVHYDKDAEGALLWWCWPESVHDPKKQYTSFSLALLVGRLRQLTKSDWEPVFVELPHEPLACRQKAERVFGSNVQYHGERAAVRVDLKTLSERLPKADVMLKPILQRLGERMIADMPSNVDATAATTAAIRAQLPERRASLELVAEKLGLSSRTLQSRLANEGTTFEALLNEARKSRAEELLRDTDLPLTEIAIILGFSELSSFTRAAQRWFSQTPSARRQKLRLG